jgi:2,3-bisphosphoglycerate-dependent phosphoglycerate mutase
MPACKLRLFLARHPQAAGNVDAWVNAQLPDHQIGLSDKGLEQAAQAGQALADYLTAMPARTRSES